nr:putative capsid [Marmot picobirnavirus]
MSKPNDKNGNNKSNPSNSKKRKTYPRNRKQNFKSDEGNRNSASGSYANQDLARDGSNDASWYAINPQLLNDAGQLSFNNPLGVGLPGVVNGDPNSTLMFTPGVCKLHFMPGVGYSEDNSSALNLAARRIYTFIRHANSGSANYDSPDLMMYLLAVNSAYMTYVQCVRAYGIANVYSMYNRYLPDALLRAAGFDPEDVRLNLANFRYGINIAAAKLGQLAVPNTMSYFKRSAWLVNNVYADSSTAKSQLYVLATDAWYTLEETASNKGTSLQIQGVDTTQKGLKVADWLNRLNTQIAKLVESEEIGIMAGDILKAYGANALMVAPAISEDYVVTPVYNEEVLTQINNCILLQGSPFVSGSKWNLPSFNITQNPDTGAILYQPYFTWGGQWDNPVNYRKPITIRSNMPTPADIMVASRGMIGGTVDTSGGETPALLSVRQMGTEVFTNGVIFKYNSSHELTTQTFTSYEEPTQDRFLIYADLSKFAWAPPVFLLSGGDTSAFTVAGVLQDWNNVTTIGVPELAKLHETALLSMFNVPSMSSDFR